MQAFYYIKIMERIKMRTSRVSAEDQYRLIMECRNSGLSDFQWCLDHNIKPGTFYNWVKRLHQNGCTDIPAPAGRESYRETPKQEIVRVDFAESVVSVPTHSNPVIPVIELIQGNTSIRIANGADPELLAHTIRLLREHTC